MLCEYYMKRYMFNVEERDKRGDTLLSVACQVGQVEIVSMLLNKGADANSVNSTGNTPLHYAVAFNFMQIGNLLL